LRENIRGYHSSKQVTISLQQAIHKSAATTHLSQPIPSSHTYLYFYFSLSFCALVFNLC
jgi:hypothetical protein